MTPQRHETAPLPTPPPQGGREQSERQSLQRCMARQREKSAAHCSSRLHAAAPGRVRLAASMLYRGDDRARLARRAALARQAGVPLIAINDVLYHHPERRRTAGRAHLHPRAPDDRHRRPPARRQCRALPQAARRDGAPVPRTRRRRSPRRSRSIARCRFSLDELQYEYPDEMPSRASPRRRRRSTHLTWEGARRALSRRASTDEVRQSLDTRARADRRAATTRPTSSPSTTSSATRARRTSSARAAARRPTRGLLLPRHHRGRSRARRPAVRALHLGRARRAARHRRRLRARAARGGDPVHLPALRPRPRRHRRHGDLLSRPLARSARSARRSACRTTRSARSSSSIWGMGGGAVRDERARARRPRPRPSRAHARRCARSPRRSNRLSAPSLPARRRLRHHRAAGSTRSCRSRTRAMDDRTVIEWDKDDLDALGILKVDVLGARHAHLHPQGLRAGRQALRRAARRSPPSRPRIRRSTTCSAAPNRSACSRSRAARRCRCCRGSSREVLRPRHRGRDRAAGPDPGRHGASLSAPAGERRREPRLLPVDRTLEATCSSKTLGVPLFQEQAMKIAIVAAGFTPAEADQLRRAMATFRRTGTIGTFRDKMIEGMVGATATSASSPSAASARSRASANTAFPRATRRASRCWSMPRPGSSATIRDVFAARCSTAQPMGFYAPAQIVRDAREHGVEVRAGRHQSFATGTRRWRKARTRRHACTTCTAR